MSTLNEIVTAWRQHPGKAVLRLLTYQYERLEGDFIGWGFITRPREGSRAFAFGHDDDQATLERLLKDCDKVILSMAVMSENPTVREALQVDLKFWNAGFVGYAVPQYVGRSIRIDLKGRLELLPGLDTVEFETYLKERGIAGDGGCPAQWGDMDSRVAQHFRHFVGQHKFLEIRFSPFGVAVQVWAEFRNWIAQEMYKSLADRHPCIQTLLIKYPSIFGEKNQYETLSSSNYMPLTEISLAEMKDADQHMVELEACFRKEFENLSKWLKVHFNTTDSKYIGLTATMDPAFAKWLAEGPQSKLDVPLTFRRATARQFIAEVVTGKSYGRISFDQIKTEVQEVNKHLDLLHEHYLSVFTVQRKWSTLYIDGKVEFSPFEPKFLDWLEFEVGRDAILKETDQFMMLYIFDLREKRERKFLILGHAVDFVVAFEARMDELHAQYKAQPLMRITQQELTHFCLQATPEFVKAVHSKRFGDVEFAWIEKGSINTSSHPMTWNSNLSNLGVGNSPNLGTVCEHALFPKLKDAIAIAHAAWEIPHPHGMTVFGKPPISIQELEPVQGYCVKYLDAPKRFFSAAQIATIMNQVQTVTEAPNPTDRVRVIFD